MFGSGERDHTLRIYAGYVTMVHARDPRLRVLRALKNLLTFWVPALLRLGYCVRQCYWEGRPGQGTTGVTARRILQTCLWMHAHLLDDWDAREEYTKTMATALLVWLPWHSQLPGCFFVEEAGEALLSRMAARCRQQRQLTGFQSTYRLFVTLPVPNATAGSHRQMVRADLVTVFTARLRAMVSMPERVMFPRMSAGNEGVWVAAIPREALFPAPVPPQADRDKWERLFSSAVALLTGPYREARPIIAALQPHVHPVSTQESVVRAGFLERSAGWRAERSRRMATDRRPIQRVVQARAVPKASAAAAAPDASSSSTQAGPYVNTQGTPSPAQPTADALSSSQGSLYEPPPSPPMSPGVDDADESDGWCSLGELEADTQSQHPASPSAACSESDGGSMDCPVVLLSE